MKRIEFTEADFDAFYRIINKKRELEDRQNYYERTYGSLKGSVFDGGFYTEVDTDKMSYNEYQEYKETQRLMNIIGKI